MQNKLPMILSPQISLMSIIKQTYCPNNMDTNLFLFIEPLQINYLFYLGIIFTITLLYLESCGIPLSVTFRIKCAVSFLSTKGA